MTPREAVRALYVACDRCQRGDPIYRAYGGAEEFEASKVLADYVLENVALEVEAQELYQKLSKPGAPLLKGVDLFNAIGVLHAELAQQSNEKILGTMTSTKKG